MIWKGQLSRAPDRSAAIADRRWRKESCNAMAKASTSIETPLHALPAPTRSTDRVARIGRFEQLIMTHLDSAYNLARWLTRNDADAEDVVQEACLRAYKYFDAFQGDR